MKKTDTLLKVASALVFCAMTAYLAVYIVNRFIDPVQTALTVTATMSDSASMSGLVVRDETVIKSDAPYIDVTAREGEKLTAGQTVAVAYASEDALARASRLTDLRREIEDTRSLLAGTGGVQTSSNRDLAVYDALTSLSRTVRGGALAGVDIQADALAGLLFRSGGEEPAAQERLQTLETEYESLLSAAPEGESEAIVTDRSGTFSSLLDGFESVSPETVCRLYPSDLRQLIADGGGGETEGVGKLVTSYKWYYAACVSDGDAERLSEGGTVKLSFGRYYDGYLPAKVEYMGPAQQGERLTLFSMDRGLTDMLAARAVSAEIIYSEYTGLRVPLKGLYRYYAGYVSPEDGDRLTPGAAVTLTLGGGRYEALVSEVGAAQRYGELPDGAEPGGEGDTRPSRRLAVFCWPWEEGPAPDLSEGLGTVNPGDGFMPITVSGYYDYDPEEETDRLCVFTMTGLQAERKKVELIYAGAEYALVSSSGDDALREGNEIIVRATGLHDGKVFR